MKTIEILKNTVISSKLIGEVGKIYQVEDSIAKNLINCNKAKLAKAKKEKADDSNNVEIKKKVSVESLEKSQENSQNNVKDKKSIKDNND